MQFFKMVNHFFNHERLVKDVWLNPNLLIDLIRCFFLHASSIDIISITTDMEVSFEIYIILLHRSFDIQTSGKF